MNDDLSVERIEWARNVLGLPRRTTRSRVQQAYRRLAKERHPDASGEESQAAMSELTEAYKTLLAFIDDYPIELSGQRPLRPEDVMRRFDGYWFPK